MTAHRRRAADGFTWEGVDVLAYKPDPTTGHPATFRNLTRQILFDGDHLASQVRFFDVAPGGHTTLERHGHAHAVIVLRGRGRCLVGEEVLDLLPHDLVEVGPWQWHQFRAAPDEPLGFVCIVDQDRDRPQLPSDGDLEQLERNPAIASFLAGSGRRAGPNPDHPVAAAGCDHRVAAAGCDHPEHPEHPGP